MNRKIRTAIATLAALAALSTVVVPGVASAASRAGSGGDLAAYLAVGVAELEVAPTGDGQATEEDCHEFEVEINELLGSALDYRSDWPFGSTTWGKDDGRAYELEQQAESLEDDALSEGCMIIF